MIKKGCHWEPADGVYKAHMEDNHCVVYLEDKPHWVSRGYGEYLTYDAVHDGTQEMYEQDFTSVTHEKHYYSFSKNYMKIPSEQKYKYWYYSVCHPITKKEYKARTTYIKGFEPRVERAIPARGY